MQLKKALIQKKTPNTGNLILTRSINQSLIISDNYLLTLIDVNNYVAHIKISNKVTSKIILKYINVTKYAEFQLGNLVSILVLNIRPIAKEVKLLIIADKSIAIERDEIAARNVFTS